MEEIKWTGKHRARVYYGWCSSNGTRFIYLFNFFKSPHPPFASPSCLLLFLLSPGGCWFNLKENLMPLLLSSKVYLGWSTCMWLSDRIPYPRVRVSGRCMGTKSPAIVPPGCVTTVPNKGRRWERHVGLGGGWAAGNKWEWIRTGTGQVERGGGGACSAALPS